jgi:hypothetical protein
MLYSRQSYQKGARSSAPGPVQPEIRARSDPALSALEAAVYFDRMSLKAQEVRNNRAWTEVGMNTAWDKFQGATLTLARSGPIKDRLLDAYRNHLASVCEEELPRAMREEFRIVSSTFNREAPMLRGEDAARATVRKMSTDEADRLACSVVRIFSEISRTTSIEPGSASGQVLSLQRAQR